MKKYTGLTKEEVKKRIAEGKVNISPKPIVKSNFQIIIGHVFNLFNAYNFIIAAALVAVQAYSSLFFVVIVVSNTVIRARQEIKSKNMVAKLNVIVTPKIKVIRDEEEQTIQTEEVVLDDIIYYETGNQIVADAIVLGDSIEVDESLLTGEADPIMKHLGDTLYSGSFVVGGACHAKVKHVGIDNYATKLTNEARNRKPVSSELINTFNKVTKITSYFIIPVSILMLYQAYIVRDQSVTSTIVNTSTALLGMLPKGLVLLTSVSLAASVVKLGKIKVLVQEMFSIETLSRIDVLCLDKTGTLTEGKMTVQNVIPIENQTTFDFTDTMRSFIAGSLDNNITFRTLESYFGDDGSYQTIDRVPFSSARKWSAVTLQDIGTIIVGAPEMILPNLVLDEEIEKYKAMGTRVLLVAHLNAYSDIKENISNSVPIAAIVIQDPLRKDAEKTLHFFKENEVNVKVISGDNPKTVSAIASQAGIENAEHYIDATTLKTDEDLEEAIMNYNVIGRASPYQKHKMILTLQKHGQKVAMTGDGVNDVLALKDADVSIAMGSGSDAAKQIAQFILIDERLETLVEVVREGRLVINNVTRSASMYYLKTIYTVCLSVVSVLLNIPYPFIPFQMTLLDMFIEGFPSFMILFERNISKPKESIGQHALRFSLPNAITIVITVVAIRLLAPYLGINLSQIFTVLYFTTAFISLHMIYRIYRQLNWYRAGVLVVDIIGFLLSAPIFWPLLEMHPINQKLLIIIIATIIMEIPCIMIICRIVNNYLERKQPQKT
ncbi:MAG: HAD-IC family P-type ATPase [Coprobacillaceae bacterium]